MADSDVTEPIETLHDIMESQRFHIKAREGLGPFGPKVDRVCYHLLEDLGNDKAHRDSDEAFAALIEAGVRIERESLDEYPWEIWESRWPTLDWLEHDVPRIFEVMNRLGHGLEFISYEPRGKARNLCNAAIGHALDNADPALRPEEEDMSQKASWVVFNAELQNAVYAQIRAGNLSVSDAVSRMETIEEEVHMRWPNKAAEAEAMASIGQPFRDRSSPKFGSEHRKLLEWALWHIVNDGKNKTN